MMTCADFIVDCLIKANVTDTFGIPGGVILPLLYAFENSNKIKPHLCYHEQSAAFAAIGYARANNSIGVAYCTKGPGLTNTITAVADAFFDSVPLIILTSHSQFKKYGTKNDCDQELDTVSIFKNITKRVYVFDDVTDFINNFNNYLLMANFGRKGPVVLDINTKLFNETISCDEGHQIKDVDDKMQFEIQQTIIELLKAEINKSKRPVILLGDGVKQSNTVEDFNTLINNNNIPVISSRYSLDVLKHSDIYFGYIGSHGTRYANIILDKADLVIAIGNRMSFPTNSKSFLPIFKNKKVIRFDIDELEFKREIPNSTNIQIDLSSLLPVIKNSRFNYKETSKWINLCKSIKKSLIKCDVDSNVLKISKLISKVESFDYFVCDVGNNEFLVCRAYEYTKSDASIELSKSFGSLGCAIGKSIGLYYALKKPILCIVGDQGLQLNIQDLQTIASNNIPINILLLNNNSSGMIKDREDSCGYSKHVHTTSSSGYSNPDFKKIANAYGISYFLINKQSNFNKIDINKPNLIELHLDENLKLTPTLKSGDTVYEMSPKLDEKLINYLKKC